jgi:2-polyprenyl-3-methyl-5-hydroxy-6-metoxy-1,4-benzoquinol methylase
MPKAAQNFPSESELSLEKGESLEICQCDSCGLVQLSNSPVAYYKEVIRSSAFSEEMRSFRVEQFRSLIYRYGLQRNNVVEIGCGKGEFLELMNDAGANACGIEYSSDSVHDCNKKGLSVSKFYIEDEHAAIPYAPFDCFFIMNFFEHLPDPNTVLRALRLNLHKDGLGIIEVPNFDMIIKKNMFSEFINDHLFYFTKKTLASLLERNGFEIIECSEIWYDYIISAVVRKRKQLDLTKFNFHQENINKQLQDHVKKYDSVAVYGAGHQALASIAIAKIGDKINYVVDDAPFKQGKYTPATHIPIVSNNYLKSHPVNSIIIMAASYSDEVARKLNNDYSSIVILRDWGLESI